GREPVGKSSRTNTANPKPTKNIQPVQLPQARAAGNCSSSSPVVANAYERPLADRSQPIGFAGRFHISRAPTVEKAPMNVPPMVTAAAFPGPAFSSGGSG